MRVKFYFELPSIDTFYIFVNIMQALVIRVVILAMKNTVGIETIFVVYYSMKHGHFRPFPCPGVRVSVDTDTDAGTMPYDVLYFGHYRCSRVHVRVSVSVSCLLLDNFTKYNFL